MIALPILITVFAIISLVVWVHLTVMSFSRRGSRRQVPSANHINDDSQKRCDWNE